jgi:sugar/nucleoside kinase (ribokinase family)
MGGVTLYSAITYSRHGVNTRVITNIAAQHAQLINRLEKHKIIVHNGQTRQTTFFINDLRTDRRMQKNLQRAAAIRPRQVLAHVNDVNCVHLGPLHPKDIDIRAINSLKTLSLAVVLDVQGLVRRIEDGNVYPAVSKHLSDALHVSQIVKANEHEYAGILDYFQTDLPTVMRRFQIREFIITAGARGGIVQETGATAVSYTAPAVKIKGDATGAGDIFLAAYVVKRLLEQHSIADACRHAADLAARQIEGNYIKEDDLRI